MVRFINKQSQDRRISKLVNIDNEVKNEIVMNTSEKVAMAQSILYGNDTEKQTYKRIKKDKGIIERTESSKTILTEDNKELLTD